MARLLSTHSQNPSVAVVVLALLAGLLVLAGCAGDDGPAADSDDLAALLPDDGELGEGWRRVSKPRIGGDAESSTLCETGLDRGIVGGAKIDLGREEDFASAYFRRYADADAAGAAFDTAADQISRCSSSEEFEVLSVGAPAVGDGAYSAMFSAPGTDPAAAADFGWTLVWTGTVVRSLQFIAGPGGSDLEADLRRLSESLAETG